MTKTTPKPIPYQKGSHFYCEDCRRWVNGPGMLANIGDGMKTYCIKHYKVHFPDYQP